MPFVSHCANLKLSLLFNKGNILMAIMMEESSSEYNLDWQSSWYDIDISPHLNPSRLLVIK